MVASLKKLLRLGKRQCCWFNNVDEASKPRIDEFAILLIVKWSTSDFILMLDCNEFFLLVCFIDSGFDDFIDIVKELFESDWERDIALSSVYK